MNFVPLKLVPKPSDGKNVDNLILVNLSRVYSIAEAYWWPGAGEAKEGSALFLAGVPASISPHTIEVQETRVEILRLLEESGKHSCQCKQPKPETSHV